MRLASWCSLVVLTLSPVSGCTCSETSAPPAPVASKPSVAAPEGLVVELVAGRPNTLLTELREAMAGPMLLLPKSVGGLAVNLLGLPVTAAELIDEALPLVGATLADESTLHSAVAIHVKDGRRFVAHLSHGPEATFVAEAEGDLTWLTAKDNLREATIEAKLAIIDNYLVVGEDELAVRGLGPYLVRTLARAEPPEVDLSLTVKDADAVARLADRLGRLAEPAESIPIPAPLREAIDLPSSVNAARELLEQIGAVSVTVNLDPKGELVVEAQLEAKGALERAALATLPEITPSRMVSLPEGTVVATQWGDSTAGREIDAERRASAFRAALGLTEDDERELRSALKGVGEGQGERMLLGLRCTGVGLTGMAEGGVRDPERLGEALEALTAMADRPSVKKRLSAERMSVEVSVGRARHIPDDVHLVRLEKIVDDAPEDAEPPSPIDLRYVVADERFYAAAGTESLAVLQHLHEPDPERQWGVSTGMKAAIARLGDSAWLAVAVDPHGLNACLQGKPGGSFSTPATLVLGPAEGGAKARLELAPGLLRVVGRDLF